MTLEATDVGSARFSWAVLIAVLIGFPMAQTLVGGPLLGWADDVFGRGWTTFFVWVVCVEWALFWLVRWDLTRRNLGLDAVGVPTVSMRDVGAVVVCGIAVVVFIVVVGDSTSPRILDGPWIIPRTRDEKLLMVVTAFTAGVCEEVLFRGYAYHALRRLRLPRWWAVPVTTTSFACIHGLEQPVVLLALRVAAGLRFFALYFWRGNLRGAILIHMAADAQLALAL